MRRIALIEVVGMQPVPWSVPEIGNRRGKEGRRYRFTTRNKSLELWQGYVRSFAEDAMAEGQGGPATGPLYVGATFFFRAADPGQVGKSMVPEYRWDEDKKAFHRLGPAMADCDNLFKGAIDPLQGIVMANDCQIVLQWSSRQWWGHDGVTIDVHELEAGEL